VSRETDCETSTHETCTNLYEIWDVKHSYKNMKYEIIKGQISWYQKINEPFKAINAFRNED